MSLNEEQIAQLLLKRVTNTLSPEEARLLDEWAASAPGNSAQLKELGSLQGLQQKMRRFASLPDMKLPALIRKGRRRTYILSRVSWAAAVILLVALSAWLFREHRQRVHPAVTATAQTDIQPGRNGAVLTLANGATVVLDSLGNGVIANQPGASVSMQNGTLAYTNTGEKQGAMSYNVIATPRGRQFELILPDGTHAWLNAVSSLRYPVAFGEKERTVEVTGEAYFEVAADAKRPFRVHVNNRAMIEVLGTHFNVNAYNNEDSIHTTLLEGSIKVQTAAQQVLLRPGEQAQIAGMGREQINVSSHVNTDKVMAWKNGLFNFEGASLQEVMLELERWYDIDVKYEKGVPDITFGGEITKGVTLKGLLSGLERSGVHFRLEGRQITVLP